MNIQDAIRDSMQTEKNAMDFYKIGATQLKNPGARKVFELLAKEEREHAGWFYKIYKGNDIPSLEEFLDAPPAEDAPWVSELRKSIHAEFNERNAMELAMQKERELEGELRLTAAKIDDPKIKAIYEKNADSTANHYAVIESEYARLMGMVHETDIDTYVRE